MRINVYLFIVITVYLKKNILVKFVIRLLLLLFDYDGHADPMTGFNEKYICSICYFVYY